MKIFISERCESISGSLGRGFGYNIQRRKNGFFGKRNPNGLVPPDGHWRFILACAQLSRQKLHITDIQVHWEELHAALKEACKVVPAQFVMDNYYEKMKVIYNAVDIINLKTLFGL